MRLYLVRHGQTSWNVLGRAQGHTDIPLDGMGLSQAESLKDTFRGIPIDRIWCSDLKRARRTAQAIQEMNDIPMVVRSDLRERAFGEWEGQDFHEFQTRMLEQAQEQGISLMQVRPPGGESFIDLWQRVGPLVEEIQGLDERLVIVSHGGTCAMLLARLIQGTPETCRSFRLGNASITEVERRTDGYYSIAKYADATHVASIATAS